MKTQTFFFFTGLLIVAALGCSRDAYEGPLIDDLYGEFEVVDTLRISNLTPNFSEGGRVKFHSEFSKPVDWKLTITGQTSGSVKVFEGFSSSVDSNDVQWAGSISEVPFFQLENCSVELTFPQEPDTMRGTLVITGVREYDGIVVADFESGLPEGAVVFHQFSMNMTFETAADDPLMGDTYFKMGGRMGWNEWLLGMLDVPLEFGSVEVPADQFYLNLGILSGIGGETASDQYLNILISESPEPFNGNLSNNGADIFQDGQEVYKYQIRPIDWEGWQYVAISYDMFEVKSPGGDNTRTPANITGIRLQCQSCPSANANCPENADIDVRTDIDYVVFTEGVPLLDQE